MTLVYKSEDWHKATLPLGSTVQQAIGSLEESGLQIVLVLAQDGHLVGTLTDGDVRRAFLNGLSLDSNVDTAINREPLVVPLGFDREYILKLMQINRIHQLPIVDDAGSVAGLHLWDTVMSASALSNTMVIMAGGVGRRLRPHTESCPKPMLEVGDKPMLEHIIRRAIRDGFSTFVVSINYLGHMIEEYFGDGSSFGVSIKYVYEEEPLGTAGSLSLLDVVPDAPLLVTNGDVLTDIRYSEILTFHQQHGAAATMAVRQYELQNQFGVVKTNGMQIEGFEEKPVYRSQINAGVYVISPETLGLLERGQACDMPSLFQRIQKNQGKTIVYPMHEPWLDVGHPDDLVRAQTHAASSTPS